MPERLKKHGMRVVGARQVMRAIQAQKAEAVFLAMDADKALRMQIESAAKEKGTPIHMVSTMEEIAHLCRVDVPSAAACVIRNINA
ncbi:MAG: ribosomal L7Ae/L30e/S12e/Gadd45 family protein [Clostridia bacterium]|nr:ribosomal L7Ae/L30e/S12e/Gadd45 family protein [Clostridia bacterium]